jgi:acetylcholinesterase/cholinesterase
MVFIHGGDYVQGYGGGPLYDGTPMANSSEVLLVSINYRLGALGFAYTGDKKKSTEHLEGNYGFLDQRLALKWVQDNIKSFGGDPRRVTIFGQSAGSNSVVLHLISSGSRGLYSGAIVESDPFGLPLRNTKNFPGFVKAFAKKAKCASGLLKDKIDVSCLEKASVETLLKAQTAADGDVVANIDDFVGLFTPWTPVLGTDDIPLEPLRAFQSGQLADVPIVVGTVKDEALEFVYSGFGSSLGELEYKAVVDAVFGIRNGASSPSPSHPSSLTPPHSPSHPSSLTPPHLHTLTRSHTTQPQVPRLRNSTLYRQTPPTTVTTCQTSPTTHSSTAPHATPRCR